MPKLADECLPSRPCSGTYSLTFADTSGNSVEHITAVTVSVKDKLNLSMSIAVGSSIQVSLALLPVLVLIGWAIGQPMMLFFDQFETITIVISVLLVNFAISDGRTNYLEGFILMCAYISIAMVCW